MADRSRMWTSQNAGVTLVSAGVAGQISLSLDTDYAASTGLASMFGCTIVRTFVRCSIRSGNAETSNADMIGFMGLGVFPSLIDQGDFPDLNIREGSWWGYIAHPFSMPGAVLTPVIPDRAAFFEVEFRSGRKVGIGERPSLVVQQTVSDTVTYNVTVTMLCLLP